MTSASRIASVAFAAWLFASPVPAADKQPRVLHFHGRVLDSDGKLIREPEPVVLLHGGTLPYNNQSRVGLDGSFKFQKLLPGSYVLIIAVAGVGEMRRTIEIAPSLADRKGTIREVITFRPGVSRYEAGVVEKSQLIVPKKAKEELQRSLKALGNNDVEAARKHLLKCLEIAPDFAQAWNQLGVLAYQTGDYVSAEQHFRRALKEDPIAYSPLVNLGGALLALGKNADSLPINQRAVKRAPEDALAHSQLGKSYLTLRDFEKAEIHLRQAKTLDPRHFSSPQLPLADLYFLQGRHAERIRELEEYLKYHPDGYFAERVRTLLKEARRDKGAH